MTTLDTVMTVFITGVVLVGFVSFIWVIFFKKD